MSKLKNKHNQRAEKVKNFFDKNKLFTVISIAVMVILIFNFLFSKVNQSEKNSVPDNAASQTEVIKEAENTVKEVPESKWQFYWIDLWILIGAGGFCVIMIIKERKKAREELK